MKNFLTLTIACVLLAGLATTGCKNGVLSKLKKTESECTANLSALNSANEYETRGMNEINDGKYECALNDCQTAIDLGGKNAGTFGCRGDAYLKLENYDAAESDFNEAVGLEPNSPITLYRRSHFYRL